MQICGYFPNYSHRQTCSKTSFARVNSAYNTAVRHFELKVSSHVTTRCFGQTSSAAHGAGLEENLNIPAGLSHVLWASSSQIFLPGVTSCFHMGNFLAQQQKQLVPGPTARDFFRALLHSLVLHCASLAAHNKMAAMKKGMQSKWSWLLKRNALRIFGCVWFLPRWDSTCFWNVHNVSSTRVAEFDFLTGEPTR